MKNHLIILIGRSPFFPIDENGAQESDCPSPLVQENIHLKSAYDFKTDPFG